MHLFISAGEPSGDHHAALLIRHLRHQNPCIDISAFGGPAMERERARLVAPIDPFAVMGFTSLPLRRLFRLRKTLLDHILRHDISAVILTDFAEFHLSLARKIRRVLPDLPLYYLIPPQVWIWRKYRIRTIRRIFRCVFPIFRFEHEMYERAGVRSVFAGHPLLDFHAEQYPEIDPQKQGDVALLPGSRQQEIRRILPVMMDAVAALQSKIAGPVHVTVVVPETLHGMVHSLLDNVPANVTSDLEAGVHHATHVLAKSGTNNLELALLRKPFVVVYKTSAVNYWLARVLIRPRFISLVNLLAGSRVVPEFIQRDATPERIASEMWRQLTDSVYRRRMIEGLKDVGTRLYNERSTATVFEVIARTILKDLATSASSSG